MYGCKVATLVKIISSNSNYKHLYIIYMSIYKCIIQLHIFYIYFMLYIYLCIYNISIIQCILTHVYSVYAYIIWFIYIYKIYIGFHIYNFFKDFKHFSQILKEIQCNSSLSSLPLLLLVIFGTHALLKSI